MESGVETQDFKDSRILKSPEKKREDFATRVFVLFFFGGGGDKVSSYKWVTGVITTLLVGVKPTYNWIRAHLVEFLLFFSLAFRFCKIYQMHSPISLF